MKMIALLAALMVALAAPSAFAGFDQGMAAAQRGDYKTALREWRPLADQGHAAAQFNLGVMYANGRGVYQDQGKAANWFLKAALQGHAYAQLNLGIAFRDGRGVPKNSIEAVKWLGEAARQGHAGAQFNLAMSYLKGEGVARDPTMAARWFAEAAERGFGAAQFNLGMAHAKGDGVPRNVVEAYKWFHLAVGRFAPGNFKDAATRQRDAVAARMTPAQLTQARLAASEWIKKKGRKLSDPRHR